MGRRNRTPKRMLTLEEQLEAWGEYPLATGPYDAVLDGELQRGRLAWYDGTRDLRRRIRARDAKSERIVDPGRDASGNFGPSPFHVRKIDVQSAPKDIGKELPRDSQYPKRATERALDWYRAHKHITDAEWKAGNALWEFHCEAGRVARTTAGYDPVVVQRSSDMDGRLAAFLDAALEFNRLMTAVPYRSQGVVRAVAIDGRSASEWAKERGKGDRDSKTHGLDRLRQGLSALAQHLGY